MSNAEIQGLFVWHELMTTDPEDAAAFYSGVFRWPAHPSSVPGYTLWMRGEVGVGGLMAQPGEIRWSGTPPSWLVYLGTVDVDTTLRTAQQLGGQVIKDATDIPAIGRFAVLADPQGAAFAVFTPTAPAPAGAAASAVISQFSWHELATSDPRGAFEFYSSLFGWSRGAAHDTGAGNTYQVIEREGAPIGGIYRLQNPSRPPYWLTYVKVDNLDGAVAAVRAAGGQIVQEPRTVPGGDRVARILDPQGGAIALHEAPKISVSDSGRPQRPTRKTIARRPAATKRGTSKSARRPATAKRSARKSARRPAAAKRSARKSARRPATAKRGTSKSARRPAAAKRSARKSARRPAAAKRGTSKSARRPAAAKRGTSKSARRPAAAKRSARKSVRAKKAVRKTARRRR